MKNKNRKENITFTDLIRITGCKGTCYQWSKKERNRVMRLYYSEKQITAKDILSAMDLDERDWSMDEQRKIAEALGV